uniref:Peptidase_M1 domain-containing protein n=1 Tax=Rhabditophanes sp. KR3021 TaxID=114890 RepID=A0AC35TNU3_9BILA
MISSSNYHIVHVPLIQSELNEPVFLGTLQIEIGISQSINKLCVKENQAKDVYNMVLVPGKLDAGNKEIFLNKSRIIENGYSVYDTEKLLIPGIYTLTIEKFWSYVSLDSKNGIFGEKSNFNHFFGLAIREDEIPFPTIDATESRVQFELTLIHPQNTTAISVSPVLNTQPFGQNWTETNFVRTPNILFDSFSFFILPDEFRKVQSDQSTAPIINLYYNWIVGTYSISSGVIETNRIHSLYNQLSARLTPNILQPQISIFTQNIFPYFHSFLPFSINHDKEVSIKNILTQLIPMIINFKSNQPQEITFLQNSFQRLMVNDVFLNDSAQEYETYLLRKHIETSLIDSVTNFTQIPLNQGKSYNTLISINTLMGPNFWVRMQQFFEIHKYTEVEPSIFWIYFAKGLCGVDICLCDVIKKWAKLTSEPLLKIENVVNATSTLNFINDNLDEDEGVIPLFLDMTFVDGVNGTRTNIKLPVQVLTHNQVKLGPISINETGVTLSNLGYNHFYRTYYSNNLWTNIFNFTDNYPNALKLSEKTNLAESFCHQSINESDYLSNLNEAAKRLLVNLPVVPATCQSLLSGKTTQVEED